MKQPYIEVVEKENGEIAIYHVYEGGADPDFQYLQITKEDLAVLSSKLIEYIDKEAE